MMQVVEEVSSLRLDILDADWVQGVYYSEFLEFGEFPDEYESLLESLEVRKTFKRIMNAIGEWLNSDEPDEEQSWAALSNHVPHEKLLAILAYFIDHGTKNVVTKELRNTALLASRVYYKFLSIPGFKAYHMYHSQLFAHSLGCLSFPKAMCDSDSYNNTQELTNEVNSVIRHLKSFVYDLQAIIVSLQLSPTDMNFEDILSNLVDITGGAIVNKLNVDKIELGNISGVIYQMIDVLICDSDGGPNPTAVNLLFKSILPKLVAASVDCRNANNLLRASYVTYSGLLLSKYGKAAISGYTILLQRVCIAPDGLERADARHARVSLVLGLMSLLPRKTYSSIVKWLIELSAVNKVPHRQIALEMLSKLLGNEPEDEKPKLPKPVQPANQQPPVAVPATNQEQPPVPATNQEQPPVPAANQEQSPLQETNQQNQEQATTNQERNGHKSTGVTVEAPIDMQVTADVPKVPSTNGNQIQSGIIDDPINFMDIDIMAELLNDANVEPLNDPATFMDSETFEQLLNESEINEEPPNIAQTTEELPQDGQATSELPTNQVLDGQAPVEVPTNQPMNGQTTTERLSDGQSQAQPNNGPPIEAASQENSAQPANNNLIIEDDSSQDSQLQAADLEMTEEEIFGLLRARAHSVPHRLVLRAVYERVDDVASTVRARAFTLLAECVANENAPHADAMAELRGEGPVSHLMAAAARGVCDERAAVRRAALGLVHRCIATSTGMQQPLQEHLAMLVGLCRDASISVRSAAISALGELVAQWPCSAVLDAFLNGPLHQLSDPETKVQDQVLALVQQILIDRLHNYTAGNIADTEDQIPWMFLDAITRTNMRRHLQRACMLLSKNANGINVRLVDLMSTHLGSVSAERDLLCLVMLTSVARHVDYGDIGFAIQYYYRLVDDTELRNADPRLMALTLELLTMWARWSNPEQRASLRDRVVTRLATAHDDGCRLAAVSLATHLDPDNLVWATELMQLSEKRAVNNSDIDEWLRAVDLSLVAPTPPCPELIGQFLKSLHAPPQEWSGEQRGMSVAGCGRLVVRSREGAVVVAPHLGAMLRDPDAPIAARHNALLVLADICIRYTCIVEPLMGEISSCLNQQADPLLRRAATRALTRLLLAEYLRLKVPLYYRYCALLADVDHEVREPAEYYVTSCLPVDTIYHHFVDCLCYYNSEKSESIPSDGRNLIYDVMVQRLSMVQRLNLQCRLAREVLEHAADVCDEGDGELPPDLNGALLDTIAVLCGPRMKLPKKPQRDGEADLDDLQERVTTNIVSHNMKKMVAEVVVPAVLRLYNRLGSKGGQITEYLVRIATDLLNDYRSEIQELIDNDEELVERVREFQQTVGLEQTFGNSRNLVTASTTYDPETPRAPRRRVRPTTRSPRKRALNI